MGVPAVGLSVTGPDKVPLVAFVVVDGQLVVVAQVVRGGHFDLRPVHQGLILAGGQGEVVPVESRGVTV